MNGVFLFGQRNVVSAPSPLYNTFSTEKGLPSSETYLLKFSKLIRSNLTNSREQLIMIREEIEMLRNYVELEGMRFHRNFNSQFVVRLTSAEQQWYIAPMLIQPYIENAIIHGLLKRESDGILIVEFELFEQDLIIYIKDNGVGIDESKPLNSKQHRSYGTQITKERMELYARKFLKEYTIETGKLSDDLRYPGTVVKIKMPTFKTHES
jgi:LytS/YehU family sensor histidine kinase